METISNDNKPIYYLMSSYFFVRSFTPVHTLYYFPFSYLYEKLSWFDQITWPTLAGKIYMGLGGILHWFVKLDWLIYLQIKRISFSPLCDAFYFLLYEDYDEKSWIG